jgi:hypothetical protein
MECSSQLVYLLVSFDHVLVIFRAHKIESLAEHIGGLPKPGKHAHLESESLRYAGRIARFSGLIKLLALIK